MSSPIITSWIVSSEFLLGGIVRLSRFPFREAHDDVNRDAVAAVARLWPVVPFRDPIWHNRYVGAWFLATGILLAHPKTRMKRYTIGLATFWSGTLWYYAWMQGLSGWAIWIPGITLALEGYILGYTLGLHSN